MADLWGRGLEPPYSPNVKEEDEKKKLKKRWRWRRKKKQALRIRVRAKDLSRTVKLFDTLLPLPHNLITMGKQ